MTAGRVGKPHGLDGSFYVEGPRHALPEGCTVVLQSQAHSIERIDLEAGEIHVNREFLG